MGKRYVFLFILLVLFNACSKKMEDKIDKPKGGLGGNTTTEYLAKIGEVIITEEDLEREIRLIPPENQDYYRTKEGRQKLLEDLIEREILVKEALKKGIDKQPEYLSKIEYLKKMALIERLLDTEVAKNIKVSDKEAKEYFEKHKAKEFTDPASGKVADFEYVKEGIKRFLETEKRREFLKSYVESLKKAYKSEIKTSGGQGAK